MDIVLSSPIPKSTIASIPSKSEAHRSMICAALGTGTVYMPCTRPGKDIEATASCLKALGATIEYNGTGYSITPIKTVPNAAEMDCGESGTTLRFMIPITAALGCSAKIKMHGRLPERPLFPLDELLKNNGIEILKAGDTLTVSGKLPANGKYSIAGNVSSQFISGMLFALTVTGGEIAVTGETESKPYINMTVGVLERCGAKIAEKGNVYTVTSSVPLCCPDTVYIGGDWSGAAFPLTMGAVGNKPITVTGLDINSPQGDKAILDILIKMGAKVEIAENAITVYPSPLTAIDIDCKNIPDLLPVLAIAATSAKGCTRLYNAARLRIKESDRLSTTAALITALGGKVTELSDGLTVEGGELIGGTVSSANDHRIAMSAAVAALFCKGSVTVKDAQCTDKSYPGFWEEFEVIK